MFIRPLVSVSEKMQEPGSGKGGMHKGERKKIDVKVQGAVKTKIVGGVGSLFVSVATPLLHPALRLSIRNMLRAIRQTRLIEPSRCLGESDSIPLGLLSNERDCWMNAVMQIMLRLPMFRTILALWAPQSYEPFQKFIDQYDADRKAHFSISSASSSELVRCLAKKMSSDIFLSPSSPHLFEIFRTILLSLGSTESFGHKTYSMEESCCLLEWDPQTQALLSLTHQKIAAQTPRHLLVFVKQHSQLSSVVPKQLSDGEKRGYYDLQGFIERRHDGGGAELIAYVKAAGKNWYQCRNQRISKLHSIHLDLPLVSSRLFYYKRCTIGQR